jgi:glycosyltransferase involved in cell wall biosynthesis
LSELKSFDPDAILVQYTPYLYSKKGGVFNLMLPGFLQKVRKTLSAPVGLVAHELHYPINMSPNGILRGFPQLVCLVRLVAAVDHVFFTGEKSRLRLTRFFPEKAKHLHWVAVGGNIEPGFGGKRAAEVQGAASTNSGQRVLLHFGSAHIGHQISLALTALERAKRELHAENLQLVFIGVTQKHVDDALRKFKLTSLRDSVRGLGYLDSAEVSHWFAKAELVLAPLLDGMSTRRSSVMSALAHGRPVVTTFGESTDPSIPWQAFCSLVRAGDHEGFAKAVVGLLRDREKAKSIGLAAERYYAENFDWRVLVKKILSSLTAENLVVDSKNSA